VRRAPALLALLPLLACVPRAAGGTWRADDLVLGGARFRIAYLPEDAGGARDVARALASAVPRVARWGPLRAPVTITIHPDHASLERAAGREGTPWLRGWATYRKIELQSPRSLGPLDGGRGRLEERIAHELAHCATYQRAGDESTWMFKEIPRWFKEGLATVTAGEGGRVGTLAEVRRDLLAAGSAPDLAARSGPPADGDPLDGSDRAYLARSSSIYRGAHHAFAFLLARYGEARVRDVLDRMGAGNRFPSAFRAAIGIDASDFEAEFRRYVVWQGWRG
jgi:hypothetical protein